MNCVTFKQHKFSYLNLEVRFWVPVNNVKIGLGDVSGLIIISQDTLKWSDPDLIEVYGTWSLKYFFRSSEGRVDERIYNDDTSQAIVAMIYKIATGNLS